MIMGKGVQKVINKIEKRHRDQLIELGVEINDSSDGTEWKLKS